MGAPEPGDAIVYLIERTSVTDEELAYLGDPALARMVEAWLKRPPVASAYLMTVGRNYQPVEGSELVNCDSYDDPFIFPDKESLFRQLPWLVKRVPGGAWVILATEDIHDAVQGVIRPH